MGNTATAVLHFDMWDQICEAHPRMWEAMSDHANNGERTSNFGFGQVISWDHSSGYQVCVVHGNTGWRLGFECEAPKDVLEAAAAALRHHGYVIKGPVSSAPKALNLDPSDDKREG